MTYRGWLLKKRKERDAYRAELKREVAELDNYILQLDEQIMVEMRKSRNKKPEHCGLSDKVARALFKAVD